MRNLGKDIRLTDELERQLMREALEEQFRFKPVAALKNLFRKLAGSKRDRPLETRPVEAH